MDSKQRLLANIIKFSIAVIFLISFTNALQASASSFTFSPGILYPLSINTNDYQDQTDYLFYHPAGITFAQNQQLKLSWNLDNFGYIYLNFNYIIPDPLFTLGLSLQSFNASDIPYTVQEQNSRPSISYYIQNNNYKLTLAFARAITKQIQIGMNLQYLFQEISSFQAKTFSGNLSIIYSPFEFIHFSIFTDNLVIVSQFIWDKTKTNFIPLDKSLGNQITLTLAPFEATYISFQKYILLNLNYNLLSFVTFTAQTSLTPIKQINNIFLGSKLHLKNFYIQYFYQLTLREALNNQSNTISFGINF